MEQREVTAVEALAISLLQLLWRHLAAVQVAAGRPEGVVERRGPSGRVVHVQASDGRVNVRTIEAATSRRCRGERRRAHVSCVSCIVWCRCARESRARSRLVHLVVAGSEGRRWLTERVL